MCAWACAPEMMKSRKAAVQSLWRCASHVYPVLTSSPPSVMSRSKERGHLAKAYKLPYLSTAATAATAAAVFGNPLAHLHACDSLAHFSTWLSPRTSPNSIQSMILGRVL